MELREKTRNCKSRDNSMKERDDKEKKEKIKDLMNKIKKNQELFNKDISNYIINCFIEKNFFVLQVNEINTYLSKSKKNEGTSPIKSNLKNDIKNSLENTTIFRQAKKKNNFELNLEESIKYLTSLLDTNESNISNISSSNINSSNSASKASKKTNKAFEKITAFIQYSPVFNYPENQNDISFTNIEENNQQKCSSYSNGDDYFTFGEQSQNKINKIINKQDEEEYIIEYNEDDVRKMSKNNYSEKEFKELEKKSNEKYIENFQDLFDKKQYLANLNENLKALFKLYKENNKNMTDFSELDNRINLNIYDLIKDLELNKINPYNKLSKAFNDKKKDFITLHNLFLIQYNSIKLVLNVDWAEDKKIKQINKNEKEILNNSINKIKEIFKEMQKDYEEAKHYEKQINETISKIKANLKEICDDFLEKKKELYQEFYATVNNIVNSPINIIKVNINDTVKCFYCYIDEIEKYYLEISDIIRN